MRTLIFIIVAAITPLTVGCGHAALVTADEHRGQIAIGGGYMEAVSDARALAVEHCRGRVALQEPTEGSSRVFFSCLEMDDTVALDGGTDATPPGRVGAVSGL